MNYIRSVSMEIFNKQLLGLLKQDEVQNVLIVGGSDNEPEIKLLENNIIANYFFLNNYDSLSTVYNIHHDMNKPYSDSQYFEKFDLIICNQVLEHLYDLNQTLINLNFLLNKDGFIWLTFPASNFYHKSPDFFSTGYSTEIIKKLSDKYNLKIIFSDTLCNQREYYYRHLVRRWPSKNDFYYPLLVLYYTEGSILKRLLYNIRMLPQRQIIAAANKKFTQDLNYHVESIVILTK